MNKQAIASVLEKNTVSWIDAPIRAKKAFIHAMTLRSYSADALTAAWVWFFDGWMSANGQGW